MRQAPKPWIFGDHLTSAFYFICGVLTFLGLVALVRTCQEGVPRVGTCYSYNYGLTLLKVAELQKEGFWSGALVYDTKTGFQETLQYHTFKEFTHKTFEKIDCSYYEATKKEL
jgi:hypothetical protein